MQKSSESAGMVRVSFLGVYFMILCLSLHLIEPYVCERIGIDFSTASELSKRMYSAAQACLHYDDFLGAHSLEHLQCILYVSLYHVFFIQLTYSILQTYGRVPTKSRRSRVCGLLATA